MSPRSTTPLLLIVVLALGLAACGAQNRSGGGGGPQGDTDQVDVIPAVEVVQARRGALPLRERLTGTVRASGEVAIYPQASGPVEEVFAQNGDAVKKGDPLVRIRATESQAQLNQARSNLDVAQAEVNRSAAALKELEAKLQRALVLGDRGIVSVESVETLKSEVETARADLAAAKARVGASEATVAERSEVQGQTLVRAPISGRVGQRNVEVGMRVDTQTALFIIGRLDNVRVEVPVTQEVLTRIGEGQRVELRAGPGGTPITAHVSRISPFLQAGSYSAEVEIDVPNESGALVPGMFVTVDIFYGESEQATLVPTSAVYEHPATGQDGVFVMTTPPAATPASQPPESAADSLAPDPVPIPFRSIEVIAEGSQTAGISGVEPGEWVVVVGQHLLSAQTADVPQARVRVVDWERILELQGLLRQDLLRQFMEKQQRLAGERAPSGNDGGA